MICKGFLTGLMALIVISANLKGQLTPQEAVLQMARGINLGNTLEPPTEGGWNNPAAQEYYFDDYKTAGFTSIRIPITWHGHTDEALPYEVDSAWLARVEEIVDWGLSRDLIIIINAHHEDWLKENYSETVSERFDSIWSQIAVKFKDKSDKLLFEMLNEPRTQLTGLTLDQINELNKRVLSIIRKTNPTRLVIFSGNDWANSSHLLAADIPDTADHYLIGYYHSYDPYPFGLEGPGTYGSAADVNATKAKFDQVTNWSVTNNIPVIISEFGATKACEFNSRMFYYATVVEQALNHGVAFNAWDDGGNFAVYQRQARNWNEIKDILINYSAKNPTAFKAVNNSGVSVSLNWTNRVGTNDSIIVQRGLSATALTGIVTLSADTEEFVDESVEANKTYYYRIISHFNDSVDLYSYPQNVRTELPENLNSNNLDLPVRVFPNPANDVLNIETISGDNIIQIQIYSIEGKLVSENFPLQKQFSIPIEQLSAGNYFVNVKTKNTECTVPFKK